MWATWEVLVLGGKRDGEGGRNKNVILEPESSKLIGDSWVIYYIPFFT